MEIAGRWRGQADPGGCPGLRWVAEEFGCVPPTKVRILFWWLLTAVHEECNDVCLFSSVSARRSVGLHVLCNCWLAV